MKHTLTNDEKWQAVKGCDNAYDGTFFYGVGTTGIFCRPSCKARTPLRINVHYFDSAKCAMDAGYRPCKLCRPDLAVFEPNRALAHKALALLERDFDTIISIGDIARQLGISESHLSRLVKQITGQTVTQHLNRIRVEKARELLKNGKDSIANIAYRAGFASLSNFYRCFRAQTGRTPRAFWQGDDR